MIFRAAPPLSFGGRLAHLRRAGHAGACRHSPLAPLVGTLTVVDPRRDWLDRLPRARNARYLEAAGLPPGRARQFFCPIGLPFGNNQPVEIALSIAPSSSPSATRRNPDAPEW